MKRILRLILFQAILSNVVASTFAADTGSRGPFDESDCTSALRVEVNPDTREVSIPRALACRPKAIEKLRDQATAFGVEIDMESLRVSGWHSSVLVSYIWWSVDLKANSRLLPEGYPDRTVLTKLTQKSVFGECF